VANYAATPTRGVAPLTVQFTDTSTGSISTWQWDFGDGTTSTLQTPIHTYTQTGLFTVRLTVSGLGGDDTETKTDYVHVEALQVRAGFVATPTEGLAPLRVNLTDMSEGVISSGAWKSTWVWDFGDGVTSAVRNPTHVYTEAGVYTVSLTVHSLSSSHTLTQAAYIWVNNAVTHHVEIPTAPVTGSLNVPITLTARFTPIRPLSSKIRYTWQATGHAPKIEETHRLTDTATFMWTEAGLKTVTIAVSEVGGTVYAQNTYTIRIEGDDPTHTAYIYLPLVMQNQP
jgi:PKD repeat protein